jgi:sugar phosphate isomerase/epimerase
LNFGGGAKSIILGSPQNRKLCSYALNDAMSLGAERIFQLASTLALYDIQLGLEAVPEAYGCEFLNNTSDVIKIINDINHPKLGINIDTGCALLSGEEITKVINSGANKIINFQASEPGLISFLNPSCDHKSAAEALKKNDYQNWCGIEMLGSKILNPKDIINSIKYIKKIYGFV